MMFELKREGEKSFFVVRFAAAIYILSIYAFKVLNHLIKMRVVD